MNNYDFGILSPSRFEQFVKDLLSEEYGIFENFAEGKDQGIDFRYSHSKEKILIVQCKNIRVSRLFSQPSKKKPKRSKT